MKRTNQIGSIGVFVIVGAILVAISLAVLYGIRQNNLSQDGAPISSDLVASENNNKNSQNSTSQQSPSSTTPTPAPSTTSKQSNGGLPKTGPEDVAVSAVAFGILAFLTVAYQRSRYLI